jgi:hypothetical protein
MEIPLTHGRLFSSSDTEKSQPVVIVDQKMADRFWPGGDAVGKRIRPDEKAPWLIIAGVVGVVKQYGLDTDTRMVVYYPRSQHPGGSMFLVARTTSEPSGLADAIVEQVRAIDPDVPVYDVATMQQRVHDSLARQRFAMTMLGAFAFLAMILAAVGVYGVMSFLVTQGTPDIAIRMALGAQRKQHPFAGVATGHGSGVDRSGDGAGRRVQPDAAYGQPAFRGQRKRPAHLCGSSAAADAGRGLSMLFPGAAGDARGPHGGIEGRIAASSFMRSESLDK